MGASSDNGGIFGPENQVTSSLSESLKLPFLGTKVSSHSAAGGPTIVKEYTVAASTVPASTSHQNLHEHTAPGLGHQRQSATATPTVGIPPPNLASISVDHPRGPNLSHPFGGRSPVNRSSGSLSAVSIQSRPSDRFSIITNSRELTRAPVGQPSRRSHSSHKSSPLPVGITTTNLPSPTHEDERVSPVVQSSAPFAYTYQSLNPQPMDEIRKRHSPTGVVEDVQSPLPISSSTNTQQVTDEPFAVDPASLYSSPASAAGNPHDERVPSSPKSSNAATLDYDLPEGRFLHLIHSDQIPRYTKDVLMQVEYTILSHILTLLLQTPRGDTFRCEAFNNHIPLVSCILNDIVHFNRPLSSFPEPSGFEQDSMIQQDCNPWVPATHPDGALYFYDEERVRVSVIVEISSHD